MSIFTKIGEKMGLKNLSPGELRFPGHSFVFFDFLRNKASFKEMARQIGDGTESDVLTTPIRWIQRSIVEAPIEVLNARGEIQPQSPLKQLLDRPNDFYSFNNLLAGTVWDLALHGDAFWLCVRDRDGMPSQLWYTPQQFLIPRFPDDGSVFISHYDYNVGATTNRLEVEDVIHFREGVDPRNIRRGLGALRGLLREIFTDDEAAVFTSSLLKNSGVPGIILSPSSPEHMITDEEGRQAEQKLQGKLSGEGRGKPIVLTGPTRLDTFGFNPQELDLSQLRDVPEERVTAALGVPAAVVGFGAGLQSTKVGATMQELVQLGWHNGVIPRQRVIASELTRTLAPQFGVDKVIFDTKQVQALREDQNSVAERVRGLVTAGIITRAMAKTELGFEPEEGDDVFLLQLSTVQVPAGDLLPPQQPDQQIEQSPDPEFLGDILQAQRKEHSPTETRIIEAAPRARPTPGIIQFRNEIDALQKGFFRFEQKLDRFFNRLGAQAERIFLELPEEQRSMGGMETKQEDVLVDDVLNLLDLLSADEDLRQIFLEEYQGITMRSMDSLNANLGTRIEMTDALSGEILRETRVRVGLVDLDQKTRRALFRVIAEAREEEGLVGEALARRIRDRVSAGPWRSREVRARVIARTETAHAANTATILIAKSTDDTEHVMVLDDRVGFGDADCQAANGTIITIAEAEAIGLAHPNCTRNFTPVNNLLLEELQNA